MPRIDDVKESESQKNYRLLRRTARVTPGNNQSVTGGRTRFIGLESLIVIGSQLVSGLLYITGSLEGVGAILWRGSIKILGLGTLDVAGPAKFSATLDVTAATRLRGPTTIEDTLDVTAETRLRAATTLEDNLTVKNAGKITVEGTIPMVIGEGRVSFDSGAMLAGSASGAGLRATAASGSPEVRVTNTQAVLTSGNAGFNSVVVDATGTSVLGKIFLKGLPTISGVSANVTVDPDTGQLGTV